MDWTGSFSTHLHGTNSHLFETEKYLPKWDWNAWYLEVKVYFAELNWNYTGILLNNIGLINNQSWICSIGTRVAFYCKKLILWDRNIVEIRRKDNYLEIETERNCANRNMNIVSWDWNNYFGTINGNVIIWWEFNLSETENIL